MQAWQVQGFIFGLKGHLGNLNFRAFQCRAGWEEAAKPGSDLVTAGTAQADRLAAWSWAGPGPGEL